MCVVCVSLLSLSYPPYILPQILTGPSHRLMPRVCMWWRTMLRSTSHASTTPPIAVRWPAPCALRQCFAPCTAPPATAGCAPVVTSGSRRRATRSSTFTSSRGSPRGRSTARWTTRELRWRRSSLVHWEPELPPVVISKKIKLNIWYHQFISS